jgi:DNA-binding response OmpR family regulator
MQAPWHMRILLIEDDEHLGEGLQQGLRQQGWVVDWLTRGDQAESALLHTPFDAVVLDWGLPGRSGLALLQMLRARNARVPVLMLTARDALQDRIAGLDSGADDYLIKPVALEELGARLRALVRRAAGQAAPVFEWGALRVDPTTREVSAEGRQVHLSAKEYALLLRLISQPRRPLSQEQLAEALYDWGADIASNAVEVHVHHLRRKLGPDWVRTIRGVGYVLNPDKA